MQTVNSISIQFIYIAPNHNKSHLRAPFTWSKSRPYSLKSSPHQPIPLRSQARRGWPNMGSTPIEPTSWAKAPHTWGIDQGWAVNIWVISAYHGAPVNPQGWFILRCQEKPEQTAGVVSTGEQVHFHSRKPVPNLLHHLVQQRAAPQHDVSAPVHQMRNVEGSQRQKVFWAPYQQVLHYLQQGCGLDPTLPVDVVNCGAVVCSHSLPWTTIAGSICAGAPVERLDGPLPWAPMPAWQSKLSPPQSELPLQCRPSGFWQNSPQPGRIWHSSSSWWQSLTELGATLIWLCGKWPILWTWPWQWGYLNRRRRSHHSCRAVAALCPHTCWTCREMGSSRTAACCSRRLSPGRQNTGTSCVSVPPWHENKHLSGWWWWTSCLIESVPAISSWSACGTSLPMYWFRMRISKMGLKHPIFLGTKEICRVKPLLSVMSGNDRHLVLITGAGSHRRENLFPLERRNTATRENNPVSVFCPSTPITRSCDAISRHSRMGHHIIENVPTFLA